VKSVIRIALNGILYLLKYATRLNFTQVNIKGTETKQNSAYVKINSTRVNNSIQVEIANRGINGTDRQI
jgi:hypothetical protein